MFGKDEPLQMWMFVSSLCCQGRSNSNCIHVHTSHSDLNDIDPTDFITIKH